MPCQIDLLKENGCVLLTCPGYLHFGEILAGRRATNRLLAANDCRGLIVDITKLRTIPPALELYHLGQNLPFDLPPGVRLALLIRPDQSRHGKLFQAVAQNAGVAVSCVFTTEQAFLRLQAVPSPVDQPAPKGRCWRLPKKGLSCGHGTIHEDSQDGR